MKGFRTMSLFLIKPQKKRNKNATIGKITDPSRVGDKFVAKLAWGAIITIFRLDP